MPTSLSLVTVVALVAIVLISMVVHEATHAYVGQLLGDKTASEAGRVSLNPLRHIDPVMTLLLPLITILLFRVPILAAKPVPFDPRRVRFGDYGSALIAVSGPLSNLLLAVLGTLVLHLTGGDSVGVLYLFVTLNVALFVFNLIPIPPLDGSRVLYAFAPEGLQQFMQQLEPMGLFIVFALVLIGGFGGFIVSLNQLVLRLLLG